MSDPIGRLLRLLAVHDPWEEVLIACCHGALPDPPRGTLIVVLEGCFDSASIALPAQLLAVGVHRVRVRLCDADTARSRAVLASWQQVLPEIDAWQPPTARPRRWRWHRPPRADQILRLGSIPLPRRALLGVGLLGGGPPRGPLNLSLDEQTRTIDALRLLADQGRARLVPATAPELPSQPTSAPAASAPAAPAVPPEEGTAARLSVDGCVACGVCVQACPNGALVLDHGGPASVLRHLRQNCHDEGACVRLCPVGALSSTGTLPITEVASQPENDLARIETGRCERCGVRHPASEGRLCRTCRYRREHAFGSSVPPEVLSTLARARSRQDRPQKTRIM